MAGLPLFKNDDEPFQLMQSKWKSTLDPLLANILMNGNLVTASLINGAKTFNHLLGRMQVGWFIVDINAAAQVYRSKPMNDKTLTLTSNAVATAKVWVF